MRNPNLTSLRLAVRDEIVHAFEVLGFAKPRDIARLVCAAFAGLLPAGRGAVPLSARTGEGYQAASEPLTGGAQKLRRHATTATDSR